MTLSVPHLKLGTVQRIRKGSLLGLGICALVLLPFVISAWPEDVHDRIETIGLACIVLAIAGRAWCTLYIGGRKLESLVSAGPYSVSRNPLYLFTFLGVFGVGLQTGAILPGFVFAGLTGGVFAFVVPHEERALRIKFGALYEDYCARVPRFGPRFSAWRDINSLEVDPARLMRTVLDVLPLLAAYPFMELLEYAQNAGMIDAVLRLY